MKAGQRTVVQVELEQSLVVRRRRAAVTGWCPACAAEVAMLTPDEAASLISITTRALYRLIEADTIHFVETPVGLIRLCLQSLLEEPGPVNQSQPSNQNTGTDLQGG